MPRSAAAASSGATSTAGSGRSTAQSFPIASHSDAPSASHTWGVRQPGTVDGVKLCVV